MDMARRDNLRREVIEPVAAMERSAAEKGLMADEKSRNGNSSTPTTYEDVKTKGLEYRQAVVEKDSLAVFQTFSFYIRSGIPPGCS